MSICDEVEITLAKEGLRFGEDNGMKNVQDFMRDIRSYGLEKKQNYSIPPLDTLGTRLFESLKASTSK